MIFQAPREKSIYFIFIKLSGSKWIPHHNSSPVNSEIIVKTSHYFHTQGFHIHKHNISRTRNFFFLRERTKPLGGAHCQPRSNITPNAIIHYIHKRVLKFNGTPIPLHYITIISARSRQQEGKKKRAHARKNRRISAELSPSHTDEKNLFADTNIHIHRVAYRHVCEREERATGGCYGDSRRREKIIALEMFSNNYESPNAPRVLYNNGTRASSLSLFLHAERGENRGRVEKARFSDMYTYMGVCMYQAVHREDFSPLRRWCDPGAHRVHTFNYFAFAQCGWRLRRTRELMWLA